MASRVSDGSLCLGNRLALAGNLDLGSTADNVYSKMFFNNFDVLICIAKQDQNMFDLFDLQYLFDEYSLQTI